MVRPVGVIRGDRVPDVPPFLLQRPVMVRTPVVRVPLWLMAAWWCLKALGLLVVLGCRWWWATVPSLVLSGLWWRFGWVGPAGAVAGVAVLLWLWWLVDRGSLARWAWRVVARWRRWWYRRRWWSAMATAGLVVRFDHHEVLPVLKKVTCRRGVDVLSVRM